MLLALRSLWEQAVAPVSQGGGGAWNSPRVNFADFVKLSDFFKPQRKKKNRTPNEAVFLYSSGQIDLTTFAALLAASRE